MKHGRKRVWRLGILVLIGSGLALGNAGRLLAGEEVLSPAGWRALAKGAQVYSRACAACHGANGWGAKGCPPLNESRWRAGHDDRELAALILHGIRGRLDGRAGANAVMPALGGWLHDEEIAAAAMFVRFRFGGLIHTLASGRVTELRFRFPGHLPWSREELDRAVLTP